MNKIFLVSSSILVIFVGMISITSSHAVAPDYVISDDPTGGDCTSAPFNGFWNSINKVCFVDRTIVIDVGETLTINQGVNLNIRGDFFPAETTKLLIFGEVTNNGEMIFLGGSESFTGQLENHGTFTNNGLMTFIGGTGINSGSLLNIGNFENEGELTFADGGILSSGTLENRGIFNNNGVVNFPPGNTVGSLVNRDTITNYGKITISGGAANNSGGKLENSGTFENHREMSFTGGPGESTGLLENFGLFTNYGKMAFTGDFTGLGRSSGSLENFGTFENHREMSFTGGNAEDSSQLRNSFGTFFNKCGATIEMNEGVGEESGWIENFLGVIISSPIESIIFNQGAMLFGDPIQEGPKCFCSEMTLDELLVNPFFDNVIDNRDGSIGNNVQGTNGKDLILASDEGDIINGKKGNDCIIGGSGDDTLDGAEGHDQIFGQDGKDTLKGNKGKDILNGGQGRDNLDGGKGKDLCFIDGIDATITNCESIVSQ